jgi:hypothetical protein
MGDCAIDTYLENPICCFKPLFKVNYDVKKSIISSSFFKIDNPYKDFKLYIDGLEKLYKYMISSTPQFSLRLFIDYNIYNDKAIMNRIRKLDKMEVVLFKCTEFMEGSFHIGLFSSLIRFFPMFDFANNDANLVLISDIDTIEQVKLKKFTSALSDRGILEKISFLKLGNISKNIYYGYPMFYKDVITPYSISQLTGSYQRMDQDVIINYLDEVLGDEDQGKYTYYKDPKLKRSGFIYGVDEYFLNKILTEYVIDSKLPYAINISFEIYSPFYYVLRSDSHHNNLVGKDKELAVETVKKLLGFFGITYDSELKLRENYNKIDEIIYKAKKKRGEGQPTAIDFYFYLYELLIRSYFDHSLDLFFTREHYPILFNRDTFGYYEFSKVIVYNVGDTVISFYISRKRFSDQMISKLLTLLRELSGSNDGLYRDLTATSTDSDKVGGYYYRYQKYKQKYLKLKVASKVD